MLAKRGFFWVCPIEFSHLVLDRLVDFGRKLVLSRSWDVLTLCWEPLVSLELAFAVGGEEIVLREEFVLSRSGVAVRLLEACCSSVERG
jgi:hypothetical protein